MSYLDFDLRLLFLFSSSNKKNVPNKPDQDVSISADVFHRLF